MKMNDDENAYYDALDIHGIQRICGYQCWEQCEPNEAEMWSLFGHLNTGGLECIGDFHSLDAAEQAQLRLERGLSRPPEEAHEALQAIREYLWDDERAHFAKYPVPDHIFRHLAALDRWLYGHERTAEEMAILDNP